MPRLESVPVLWRDASECCGCGACAAACPRGAVAMTPDADGFLYPEVDPSLCVRCGACLAACGFKRGGAVSETTGPSFAAAGATADLSRSASGGLFAEAASAVLGGGGAVCACSLSPDGGGGLSVRHEVAEDAAGLAPMLGSKYVQSDAGPSMREVRRLLRGGREVLFCGTPCQVAGLRSFLGRDWPNLITVDLVCHGVPSPALFAGYLGMLAGESGGEPVGFTFRSKRDGWGHSLLLLLLLLRGEGPGGGDVEREVYVRAGESSYYDLFLSLETLRESCYACPFACARRPGDLTIGDFWGVEVRRPELLKKNGGSLDEQAGISCLVANTDRGRDWLEAHGDRFVLCESSFEEVAADNDQLRHPSARGRHRDEVYRLFREGGYAAVERWWKPRHAAHKAVAVVKGMVPKPAKDAIKGLLRKNG